MKTKTVRKVGSSLGCLLALFAYFFIIAVVGAISWLATCGVVYLITLCFGCTFSVAVATGIWLVLLLLGAIFKN